MKLLTIEEVVRLHARVVAQSGGAPGIRDQGGLESAIAQPRMSFGGQDHYPQLTDKVAALCFSLVLNHPFVDGNKRIGHAAMETMLVLNGYELAAPVDEAESVILRLAAGALKREEFTSWVTSRVKLLGMGLA